MMYLASSLNAFVWVVLLVAILFAPQEDIKSYLQHIIDNMN